MSEHRRYTAEERAEAVGLALSVGPAEAGKRLNLPHRTVSSWLAGAEAQPIIVESRAQIAARLWQAFSLGVERLEAGLREPTARLGDVARAVEVLGDRYALLTGGPTANVQTTDGTLSDYEMEALAEWLDRQLDKGADPALIAAYTHGTPVEILPELPAATEGTDQ